MSPTPTPPSAAREAGRERPLIMSGPMIRALLDGTKTQTRRVLRFPGSILAIEGGVDLVAFDRMQPGYADGSPRAVFDFDGEPNSFGVRCPYGQPGDRLWVRETWATPTEASKRGLVAYRADGECGAWMGDGDGGRLWSRHGGVMHPDVPTRSDSWRGQSFSLDYFGGRWRPSIHMPRAASRLTLEVTGVRVERVQDISEADARDEGIWEYGPGGGWKVYTPTTSFGTSDPRESYRSLWDSLNASRGYGWAVNPWVWVLEFRALATLSPEVPRA